MSTIEKIRTAKPEEYLKRAQQFMQAGQDNKAFASCRFVVQNEPTHGAANYNMAAILLRRSNPLAALGYAITATESDPKNSLYRLAVASALVGLNCFDMARQFIKGFAGETNPSIVQAVRSTELQIQARINAGEKPVKAVKGEQAFNELEKAVQEKGIEHPSLAPKILSLILGNRSNASLWLQLFGHLAQRKRLAEAESAVRRAFALEPTNPQCFSNLAFVHDSMGDQKLAEAIYTEGLEKTEPSAHLIIQYFGLLMRLGKTRWIELEALMDRYAHLGDNDPNYLTTHAQAKDNLSKIDEALALMDRALKMAGEDAAVYYKVLVYYLSNDELEKASEAVEAAESHIGNTPIVRAIKGVLADAKDDYETAYSELEPINKGELPLEIQARVQFALAKAKDKRRDYEGAYECYRHANEIRGAQMNVKYRFDSDQYIKMSNHVANLFTPEWVDSWTPLDLPTHGKRRSGFIFGLPRSGTTLLDTILRAHGAFELLEEEPFLSKTIEARVKDHGWRYLAEMSEEIAEEARADYFADVEAAIGGTLDGKYLIDRHALNSPLLGATHRLFPESKLIFIARHPLDVILSGFIQDFQLSGALVNYLDLERAALFYDASLTAFKACADTIPAEVHVIRYEDLVADTENEMRALLGYLGVDWNEAVLSHEKSAASRDRIRTASHSQVKKPIYKSARYRWKNYRFALEPHIPRVEKWIEYFGYDV